MNRKDRRILKVKARKGEITSLTCRVCGEKMPVGKDGLVPPEHDAKHQHPGHPLSRIDENGNLRS